MRSIRQTSGRGTAPSRARLSLEALDSRFAPSDLFGSVVDSQNPNLDSSDTNLMILREDAAGNMAPKVANFAAVAGVGGVWRFTGDVIDEAPAGLTIAFGGEPGSLQSQTATTNANGHFDKTVLLRTDGSDNGTASAKTTDAGGLASNVALYMIVT
jgi:hypothetical protein